MNKNKFTFYCFSILSIKSIFIVFFLFTALNISAQQYNACGTAVATSTTGCYQLTHTTTNGGAVWNIYKIDLTQSFDITLTLNFGNNLSNGSVWGTNCGADGMSFILQPLSSSTVSIGGLVGFGGITPSLGVVMDTYWGNASDPAYHHISINKNGDPNHTTYTPSGICPPTGTILTPNTNELAPYCSANGFPANITDGLDHLFHFVWTPGPSGVGPGTITVYFGNATSLPTTPTITYTGDIVTNVFGGNSNVYWGVSASTGSCWNYQTVCMTTISNFASDTAICEGQPLTFIDNSISGLQITTWSWDFGDNTYDYTQFPGPHTYNTPGLYNANLFIMNSGGFSSTMTHTITVNPKPNVIVNDTSVCKGDSAVLTATGAFTYTWDNGLTPGNPKHVSPPTTTSYVVTGKNTFGCTNTDTALVTIYPNPMPVITPSSYLICVGDPEILTASGADSYIWILSGDTINPLSVSPTSSTDYILQGTTVNGCKRDTNVLIQVNPNPIVGSNNDTICLHETAVLTATGATTYVWRVNGATVSSVNPLSISPPTTTIYNVLGTDVNGCKDSINATITVNMPPVITADSVGICIGQTATINVYGGNPNDSYLWLTDYSTINPIHVSPIVSTYYPVIATDFNGCKDTAYGYVNVYPNPVPVFTFTPTMVSTDAPDVVFYDGSTYASNWLWDFGDPNSANDSSAFQSPTHPYTIPGKYIVWLYVTSDFGCKDSTFRWISVQTPTTFYIPNAFDPTSNSSDINVFKPKGKGVDPQRYLLVIFDRWGKEVFTTTDWEQGWNGKFNNVGDYLPHGVYVYYIKYKELYGIYKERTGNVTLFK